MGFHSCVHKGPEMSGTDRSGSEVNGLDRSGKDWLLFRRPHGNGMDRNGLDRTVRDGIGKAFFQAFTKEWTGQEWRAGDRSGKEWRSFRRPHRMG